MKTFTLFALALLAAWPLFAQKTITVDQNSPSPGMYTNLQAALDAAGDGDIILIKGSDQVYNGTDNGTINIDKNNLTLIGSGYSNPYGDETKLGSIYVGNNASVSGLVIKGVQIQALYINPASGNTVESVKLEDNGMSTLQIGANYGTVNGVVIRNNIISDLLIYSYTSTTDLLVSNNIFHRLRGSRSGNANLANVVMQHNLFAYSSSWGNYMFGEDFIFDSNIFWKIGQLNGTLTDNVFSNNIFYESDAVRDAIGTNDNTGTNNRDVTTDPLKAYDGTGTILDKFSQYDFHQSANPPLLNVNNQQIGIYGGSYAFTATAEVGGLPNIPVVTSLTIENVSVQQGGTLKVSFEAKTQQ